jgi:hypothetical protein
MKNRYAILTCALYILLSSCSQSKVITGMYSGKKNPHVFTFSKDSMFKYEYHDYCYKESSGTWYQDGDFLYLNSLIKTEKIPLEYTKLRGDRDTSIVINIEINSQNNPQTDYICWPFINGKPCSFDPERGAYSFSSDILVENIYFKIKKSPFVLRGIGSKMCYDDIETEPIELKLSFGDNLNVVINIIDCLFGYKVFSNEKLEIRSRKIILKEGSKTSKLHLRQSLKVIF